MTTIDPLKSTVNTYKPNQPTVGNNDMGKDVFLKILTTQLRNQDPTQPMEDREFIAQLAQFSTLEQIANLNQGFNQFLNKQQMDISHYSPMINKEVTWNDENTGIQETGIIKGVMKKDQQYYYQINNQEIPVGDIISTKEAPTHN